MNTAPIRKGRSRTAAAARAAAAASGMAALAVLTGCMMRVPMHESKVEGQVPTKAANIVPQVSDRASVRAQMGEPWLSSTYWQFDLYHLTGRSTSVPVMWVFYWPVPLGVAVDETTTYVLAAYDAEGRVTANAIDVARDPSIFDGMEGEPAGGLAGMATTAHVAAGDVAFITTQGEGDAQLSVAASKRDDFVVHHPPTAACRVIVGCQGNMCEFDAKIDDGPTLPQPYDAYYSTVAVLQTPPGTHRLHVGSSRALQDFEATQAFTCAAGETVYAVVENTLVEHGALRSHWSTAIVFGKELPEALKDARLVIWSRGSWLAPQEPVP